MAEIIVSNSAELAAALNTASGGDTILLQGGNYGDFTISNENYNSEVIIKSADSSDPAVFRTVTFKDSSNITFDSVEVDFTPNVNTTGAESAVWIQESSDISFKNSTLSGEEVSGALASAIGAREGYPIGRGITVLNSEDVALENNDISLFHRGIVPAGVDGLDIIGNEIYDLRTSPITGGDVRNVNIDDNYFHSSKPWALGGSGDHGDYIHLWIVDDQDETSGNISITNNYFAEGNGESLFGIFLQNGGSGDPGFANVLIDGNIISSHGQPGIKVNNADGVSITNNSLIQNGGGEKDGAYIDVGGTSTNVEVGNNIMSGAITYATATIAANANEYNNIIVQRTDPDGDYYIGDLFVNGLTAWPSLADLQALPGGLVEQMGVGSKLQIYDNTPDSESGIISVNTGEGFDLLSQAFDISTLSGPDGAINTAGASVVWSFGDGTSSSATSPIHTYDKAGSYDVKATVTTSDGSVIEIQKNILVESPVSLEAFFNGDINDSSDFSSPASTSGNVTFEQSGGREAIRLNNGNVEYNADDTYLNNKAYTLLFDFKKDAGQESEGGTAIYFSSSFVIKLGADSISGAFTSDQGNRFFNIHNVGINNSDWHQLAMTFSSEAGEVLFYVDGVQVGSLTGLDGATQVGNGYQPFVVGGRTGDSFGGLMDDVRFYRDAMTEDQVKDSYANMGNAENAEIPASDNPVIDDPVVPDPVDPDPVDPDPVDPDPVDPDPVDPDPVDPDPVDPDPVDPDPVDPDPVDPDPVDPDPVDPDPVDPDPVDPDPVDPDPVDPDPVDPDPVDPDPVDPISKDKETVALNKAAEDFGDGIHNLGRGEEYFGFNDFTASITFSLDSLDGGRQRLLWNHTNYGIQIKGDDLVVYFGEEGEKMDIFFFRDAIPDTDWHDVQLVLDDDADTFSIYMDGNLLKAEEGVTGGITDEARWDVTVGGTNFRSSGEFEGQIADFSIIDQAVEIDASMSVYERTVAIDALDEHNPSQVELIGIALQEQDALDFS